MKARRIAALKRLYFDLPLKRRPCPLCGGLSGHTLLRWDRHLLRIHVEQCDVCGFVHAARSLDGDGARQFYTEIYPLLMYRLSREDPGYDRQKQEQAAFRWRRIRERIGVLPAHLFELGCGNGHFLAEAKRLGVSDLAAVEPDAGCRKRIADGLGMSGRIWSDLDEARRAPADSDMIAMFHVLEHLADPLATLREITKGFDGWLVIEVPDLMGDWSSLGLQNFHVAHRSYFTVGTLRALLAKAGFAILHEEREGIETGIFPGNLRVFARRGENETTTPPDDPVAAHVAGLLKPWSIRNGYPRSLGRIARLVLT